MALKKLIEETKNLPFYGFYAITRDEDEFPQHDLRDIILYILEKPDLYNSTYFDPEAKIYGEKEDLEQFARKNGLSISLVDPGLFFSLQPAKSIYDKMIYVHFEKNRIRGELERRFKVPVKKIVSQGFKDEVQDLETRTRTEYILEFLQDNGLLDPNSAKCLCKEDPESLYYIDPPLFWACVDINDEVREMFPNLTDEEIRFLMVTEGKGEERIEDLLAKI